MSLKFGELWGEVRLDDSKVKPEMAAAVSDGERELSKLESHGQRVGRETGEQVADGTAAGMDDIGDGMAGKFDGAKGALLGAAAGAAAAAGAVFAAALATAMDVEKGADQLSARLALTGDDAKIAGGVAGRLFAGAFGEDMTEVNDAVDAVASTLTGVSKSSEDDLEGLSAKALGLSSAFGVDVAQSVNTVGTSIRDGLTTDSDQAFDLITTAMQRMPAGMREELFPIIDEYGIHLQGMGITGADAFGLLVEASKGGQFRIDKTGDAIKELSIRATDMSATSVAAYQAAGLSAEDMSARFLAGGDTARGALDDLVDGLLGIEDPTTRANAAIALFGTPIEDLGVTGIPDFLKSLDNMDTSLGDVEGAADTLNATLGDNAATETEKFKRAITTNVTDWINNTAVPAFRAFPSNTASVWDEIKRQWSEGASTTGGAWGNAVGNMRYMWERTGLASVVGGTMNLVGGSVSDTVNTTRSVTRAGMALMRGDWSGAWSNIQSAAQSAGSGLSRIWGYVWRGLVEIVGGALGAVWSFVTGVFDRVVGFIGGLPGRVSAIASGMFTSIASFAARAVQSVLAWLGALPGKLLELVGRVGGAAGAIGRAIMDNIGRGLSAVAGFIGNVGSSIWSAVKGFLNDKFFDPIRGFKVSILGRDFQPFGSMPRLHTGGRVPGPLGAEVPAVLMAGETVRTIEQEQSLRSAIAALAGAATAGMGGSVAGLDGARGGAFAGVGGGGSRGSTTIHTLQVVSNDPPRRWLEEGLWRVAG